MSVGSALIILLLCLEGALDDCCCDGGTEGSVDATMEGLSEGFADSIIGVVVVVGS